MNGVRDVHTIVYSVERTGPRLGCVCKDGRESDSSKVMMPKLCWKMTHLTDS